jgi:two-component system cell cycle response regulator DivK
MMRVERKIRACPKGDSLQDGRKRLLLIEDSLENLVLFRTILEYDFDLTACISCSEALNQIQSHAPDLLLMDIAMAEMNGIECLKRIRSLPEFKDIPAIAVTALAYPEDRRECLEAGFQAVVVKPVLDIDAFRRLIETTIRSS